ncbi:UDP-N-acetylmuramate dehydrogenase [Gallalistipes aquisgranensis]|uniref:UDP-N-acetylmuramate dehydrogenase n=1 Tax=Gallalistipes aquisgranensis TaxID=2779358 RepID=UPI001CF820FE|nr:UDP-N-acetylmuramate dehydrogenase [Gallalistipes aquisgranensis]MBE5032758.1 UDP-N-acetylmuramate dehydrogenase [Gallalistipes aquisgranensis]
MMERFLDIDLTPYNSFGVPARADRMVTFDSREELRELLADGEILAGRWGVLSGGNNILFTQDFRGTLLHPVGKGIEVLSSDVSRVRVRVQAGLEWDDLVAWAVERGLWGLENLSLIPGYVGAAPVQNIGAYGAEAKDTVEAVELLDTGTLAPLTLAAAHCGFGYRESVFKGVLRGRAVITAVVFSLGRVPRPSLGYGDLARETAALGGPSLENIRRAVTAIRRRKLPDPKETGNAGSFFKNPVVERSVAERLKERYPDLPLYPAQDEAHCKLPAGWLIDRAGWKGHARPTVGVHGAQALVLVNRGGATGTEVLGLASDIRRDVEERFGVRIETEVNVW